VEELRRDVVLDDLVLEEPKTVASIASSASSTTAAEARDDHRPDDAVDLLL
jgi:hypothetical protein